MNPDTSFLGVDLSDEMLSKARQHIDALGVKNVEFLRADMTDLREIADGSADGVVSTMALHHLPTHAHLERCLSEIRRIRKQDGALYLVDFGRLKVAEIGDLLRLHECEHQPHIFSLDYERFLCAAFLRDEFDRLAADRLGSECSVRADLPDTRSGPHKERRQRRGLPATAGARPGDAAGASQALP